VAPRNSLKKNSAGFLHEKNAHLKFIQPLAQRGIWLFGTHTRAHTHIHFAECSHPTVSSLRALKTHTRSTAVELNYVGLAQLAPLFYSLFAYSDFAAVGIGNAGIIAKTICCYGWINFSG
jgi:hypothetical protein